MTARGHLVLGAGCAGLSVALALLRAGVREPIRIVDTRTGFERDRTWCLFDVGPMPFAALARRRWSRWSLAGAAGGSARHPYLHLDAEDVYAAALAELGRARNVELSLGVRVRELGDGWALTDAGRLEAGRVYDALALGSPALRDAQVDLWQRFLGYEVRCERAVFDPGTATLMDFRTSQARGLAFMYVLPFAPDRALVEHTTIGARRIPPAVRREAIAAYLEELGAGEWVVEREERGAIPMTSADLGAGRGRRTVALGVAGGAVRPSSGYAFARIQRHAQDVARAVASGAEPPRRPGSARVAALDAIFLRVLAERPQDFPGYFRRLGETVPGDALARFMGDAATPADEARVIGALPKAPFVAAALRAPLDRARSPRPRRAMAAQE